MKLKRGEWIILVFSLLYIIGFGIYFLTIGNYEFIWYILVMIFFFMLIFLTLKKSKFDYLILLGLSIWGLAHMAGGGIKINGEVLYALEIIKLFNIGDTFVLKYDQLIHAYGFMVTTLIAHHLLSVYWNKKVNYKIVYPALVLISMGLGCLNEIVEFMAVVMISSTNVGGYYNTALDLVFNTLGAIIGVFIIHLRRN